MDANGRHTHKAIPTDANVSYPSIDDWSFDSTRLLVDQVSDNRWVQIIDVRSHAGTTVTKGTVGKDAWFHP